MIFLHPCLPVASVNKITDEKGNQRYKGERMKEFLTVALVLVLLVLVFSALARIWKSH